MICNSDYPSHSSLYPTGSIHQDLLPQPDYGSINRPSFPLSGSLIAGLRRNGRMSVVRRFFCLFVTFDLLFTSLLWLICLVLVGNFSFYSVFESEIVHYQIQTSLFDIVMAALLRFTALILFYALLQINHWIIVALTTAGTCAFIVAKVYFFNWGVSSQPVMQVLLILSSFVLAWAEAWFLDLRVMQQEKLAREYLNASIIEDRSPHLQRFLSGLDTLSESVGTFYSPVESPEDSGDEFDKPLRRKIKQILTNDMHIDYRKKGEETLEKVLSLLNNDQWNLESHTVDGDKIFKQKISNRTVFYFNGIINIAPSTLFHVLWKDVERMSLWNSSVIDSKIIDTIDVNTDICYQLTQGAGVIKKRDFVILRFWHNLVETQQLIIANKSVVYPLCPEKSDVVRGENGPSCWIIKKLPNEINKCELLWLLNTNIKGWVPQKVLNSTLTAFMMKLIYSLREHTSNLGHEPPSFNS